MRVELNLPDKAWAQVLEAAEATQTTVPRFIEAAIRDAIRPSAVGKLHTDARHHAVLQAWGEGLTDAQIAERTGELKQYVGDVRRGAKLPPNLLNRAKKYHYERKAS